MTPNTAEQWRALILRLVGREYELTRPDFDGVLRCTPFVLYGNDLNRRTCELLGPAWPVSNADVYDIRDVLVTGRELLQLYRLPPEAFTVPC